MKEKEFGKGSRDSRKIEVEEEEGREGKPYSHEKMLEDRDKRIQNEIRQLQLDTVRIIDPVYGIRYNDDDHDGSFPELLHLMFFT